MTTLRAPAMRKARSRPSTPSPSLSSPPPVLHAERTAQSTPRRSSDAICCAVRMDACRLRLAPAKTRPECSSGLPSPQLRSSRNACVARCRTRLRGASSRKRARVAWSPVKSCSFSPGLKRCHVEPMSRTSVAALASGAKVAFWNASQLTGVSRRRGGAVGDVELRAANGEQAGARGGRCGDEQVALARDHADDLRAFDQVSVRDGKSCKRDEVQQAVGNNDDRLHVGDGGLQWIPGKAPKLKACFAKCALVARRSEAGSVSFGVGGCSHASDRVLDGFGFAQIEDLRMGRVGEQHEGHVGGRFCARGIDLFYGSAPE